MPHPDHCLEMKGLREQIGERDGFDRITVRQKHTQIARQRRRIAGNIYQRRRRDLSKQRGNVRTQARSRRIDDDQVGPLAAAVATQKIER